MKAAMIRGLDRLNRKFARLPIVAREDMTEAMEKGANEIVALAKSLTTSDRVRASIGWTYGAAPEAAMVLGEVQGNGHTITIYAGSVSSMVAGRSKMFQLARLLEHGTQNMGARPFFFVSFRALRKRTKNRIRRAARKSAKKVAAL